jgi:hypothetical protein
MSAAAGDDRLFGGNGSDRLFGGAGVDLFEGGDVCAVKAATTCCENGARITGHGTARIIRVGAA